MDAPPPTAPAAERPARPAGGRTRTALVLLVVALVVPLGAGLAGPMTAVGNPLMVLGMLSAGAAGLALVAALVAPVGVGPRAAVAVVSLANGGAGLWLATLDAPTVSGLPTLSSALTGPLQLPAMAWLGAALATGLGDRIGRSWRTSVLLTGIIAALQVLLSVVAVGTYGAAFGFATGGVDAYLLIANAVGTAATVAMAHVVVSVVRTWHALDGGPVVPALRPWLLAMVLAGAVAVSIVIALVSGVL